MEATEDQIQQAMKDTGLSREEIECLGFIPTKPLTETELEQVENYIANKWQLQEKK